MKNRWVYEIIDINDSLWIGNLLYNDFAYAKFCAEQDYKEYYPEEVDSDFTWDFVCKGFYQMLIDEISTDVELRVRHINSLEN